MYSISLKYKFGGREVYIICKDDVNLFLMVPHNTVNKVPLLSFSITFKFPNLFMIGVQKGQKKKNFNRFNPVPFTWQNYWLKYNSRLQTKSNEKFCKQKKKKKLRKRRENTQLPGKWISITGFNSRCVLVRLFQVAEEKDIPRRPH